MTVYDRRGTRKADQNMLTSMCMFFQESTEASTMKERDDAFARYLELRDHFMTRLDAAQSAIECQSVSVLIPRSPLLLSGIGEYDD